ncbi:MAG: hypothetical protein B7C24_14095 [Bacteroidetes bacterium 4572_77]|nr:MAG: hypothetical protein B7C24_14095 [Bacteroidetes bacterium 4572_77]
MSAICWDTTDGSTIENNHYDLGYTIPSVELNYHSGCWDPYGYRAEITFTDPDGTTYGPYTGSKTWSFENYPDDYAVVNIGLTLNKPGQWIIHGEWEEKLSTGWEVCGDKTETFWVGDATTCYQCQNYLLVTEEFYSNCPLGWTPEPEDCGTAPTVTCYQCVDNQIVEDEKLGTECPEGWESYPPAGCEYFAKQCWKCESGESREEWFPYAETCPTGWQESEPDCEIPRENTPGFEILTLIVALGIAFLILKKKGS